ncbi:MAG: hypothetical protein IKB16_00920 [Lentisphaeria bacterium]|nr:hypothetical protein [Lentisphaeria bacterium]
MAEELQGLLNRIQEDGLRKSEEERNRIVSEAEAKAARIVAEAQAKADKMIKEAEESVKAMEAKSEAAIRQSARDIQIALRSEMQERLRNVVKHCAGQALTAEMMAGLILEMARSYAANPADKIEVLLPAATVKYLEDGILAGLGDDLRARTQILGETEMNSGLQLGFRDGDVFLDFTDEALADLLCAYVGPKLAAILKG